MQGRAIAQKKNAHLLDQPKIFAPVLIMFAFFHLIYTHSPLLNCRNAIFNASSEHKCWSHYIISISSYELQCVYREQSRCHQVSRQAVNCSPQVALGQTGETGSQT